MLQGVTGCCRVLQGVTRCCRVLQGVTRCYKVLQGVSRFYRVLQGVSVKKNLGDPEFKTDCSGKIHKAVFVCRFILCSNQCINLALFDTSCWTWISKITFAKSTKNVLLVSWTQIRCHDTPTAWQFFFKSFIHVWHATYCYNYHLLYQVKTTEGSALLLLLRSPYVTSTREHFFAALATFALLELPTGQGKLYISLLPKV